MQITLPKPVGEYEQKCLREQWSEYSEVYLTEESLSNHSNLILQELNGALTHWSYITGNTPNNVDKVLFKKLQRKMGTLSLYEKELYVHLSRWFSSMQAVTNRGKVEPILFSRSLLY